MKCWIYKSSYEKGDVEVTDHDRITGKNSGSAHQKCNLNLNLNLSLDKKSLLCFTIFKTMIHILSFKKLENVISKLMLYQKQ